MVVELGVGEGVGVGECEGVGEGDGFAAAVPGADVAESDKLRLPPHPPATIEINNTTLKETANLSSYILGGRLSRVAQLFRRF